MTCTGAGLAFSQYSRFDKRLRNFNKKTKRIGKANFLYDGHFYMAGIFYMTGTGADCFAISALTNAYIFYMARIASQYSALL